MAMILTRPVPIGYPVTQKYGEDPAFYAPLGYAGHHGEDRGTPVGVPVRAALAGSVYIALQQPHPTAGRYVHLIHEDGVETRYLHLETFYVRPTQWVDQGDVIGLSGNTGLSTDPHLHFEIIDLSQADNGYKGRVDPASFTYEDEGGIPMRTPEQQRIIDVLWVNANQRLYEMHRSVNGLYGQVPQTLDLQTAIVEINSMVEALKAEWPE